MLQQGSGIPEWPIIPGFLCYCFITKIATGAFNQLFNSDALFSPGELDAGWPIKQIYNELMFLIPIIM